VATTNLYNDGTNIGIGTTNPTSPLTVIGNSGPAISGEHTGITAGATAVYGLASASSGVNYGVYGETNSTSGFGVFSAGDFGGTGAKFFIQPHPTDATKEIRFVCLEGNEAGTYFRGSAELVDGIAVIDVPEEFRLVTNALGVTVQVTPRGPGGELWVDSIDLNQIVIRGVVDVKFDYLVNGFRLGYENLEPMMANSAYVPAIRGVPYGTQYPQAIRDLLVQNGILNPDYTPNEAKAAELGWILKDPEPEPAGRLENQALRDVATYRLGSGSPGTRP